MPILDNSGLFGSNKYVNPPPKPKKQKFQKSKSQIISSYYVIYLQSMIGVLVPAKMSNLNGPAERHFQTPSSLCQKTVEYETA